MSLKQTATVLVTCLALIAATAVAVDEPARAFADVADKNFTNSLDMQFVKIPAGEFQMGITENDAARLIQRGNVDWPLGDWKKQVHKVKLTQDYYLGKHEVTVGQFRKFVEATKYETNAEDGFNAVRTTVIEGAITAGTWREPQFKQDEDHPVVCVTSVDAQKFIDWLNKMDEKKPGGWEYRLPTEAEWEYAARGPKGFKYPWGDDWREYRCRPAPEGMCFRLFSPEFVELRTHRVSLFSPHGDSAFGVSDMAGNVSEWCSDWYEDNYPKKDQTDPLGPIPGTISRNGIYASPHTKDEEGDLRIQQTMKSRVFKGDSWYDEQRFMSIAQRRYHPYGQRSYIGFRVALAPIIADRKWPAARAIPPRPGMDMMAPTKSSRERLAAFLADAAVTEELYKEIVAADQMGILVSLDKKPERAIQKYYALLEDLTLRTNLSNRDLEQRPPTVGELGLLLLAGSDPQMPKSSAFEKGCTTIKGCTEIVLEEPKPRRLLLRQLIKSWMLAWVPGKKEFNTIAQFYGLKEVAAELAAMAVAPDTKPEIRFSCLYTLINLGSEKELEPLSNLLKDEDIVPEELFQRTAGPLDGRLPQQWRDLALLVMVQVAGDDLNEYGFAKRTEETRPSRYDMDLAFRDDTARKDGLEKWQARETKSKSAAVIQAETAVFAEQSEPPKKHEADLGGGVKMELVLIPAGKFKMGSGESAEDTAAYFNKTYRENFPADGEGTLEAAFFENEHPQHEVRITKPFFLGMYPVTRGQFRQFVAATSYKTDKDKDKKILAWGWDPDKKQFSNDEKYSWQNTGFEQTDEHPVVNVTWNDAMAFCKWLSEKEGHTYLLPTEAEWEYACRAGTTTRYPSGDDPQTLGKISNLVDATVKSKIPDWKYMIYHSDNYAFTSPVGKSKPNAFGLYDMHGNAFQWCSDWYADNYYAASPADDPAGPDSGKERVVRGGTWNFRPLGARSADRNKTEPDGRNCAAGFRVVRTQ